nr:hypothetical protein [Tanacetum cinerariifolium]
MCVVNAGLNPSMTTTHRIPEYKYSTKSHVFVHADREGLIKEVITKTMTEPTLEEHVNKTQGDYYSGITKMMINGKAAYELKWKFFDDLRNNAFSGTNGEDAVEHIENFLKIVDPLDLPNVSYERLRLAVFPNSLT